MTSTNLPKLMHAGGVGRTVVVEGAAVVLVATVAVTGELLLVGAGVVSTMEQLAVAAASHFFDTALNSLCPSHAFVVYVKVVPAAAVHS